MPRIFTLGALSLALLVLGCRGEGEPSGTNAAVVVRPVPAPDLSAAEARTQAQIESLRADVDSAQRAGDDAALAAAYGELGSAYVIYEFLEAAEVALGNAAALAPEAFRWPYLLGYLAQLRGQLDTAADHYARAEALEPAFPPIRLRLARLRLEEGAFDAAETLFARALEEDPQSAAALEGLGKIADARDEASTAVAYYRRALDLDPGATSLEYALGQAYRRQGDLEKANEHLARRGDVPVRIADPLISGLGVLGQSAQLYLVQGAEAMEDGDFQAAAGAYQRALELDAQNLTAYRGLAVAVERLGDMDAAIAHLERGVEVASDAADEDPLIRAETLGTLGSMLVAAGRDAEAIERFGAAQAAAEVAAPASASAERASWGLLRGNALARSGQMTAALDAYDDVLESMDQPAAAVLLKKATVLVNLDRKDDARAVFDQALAAAPDDAALRARVAEALDFLGDDDGARAQRVAAGRLIATDSEGNAGGDEAVRLLLEDARARRAKGDLESAVTRYDQALERAPAQYGARFELAQLLGHLGYMEDAQREFRTVADAQPRHAGARRGEITVLLLLGRFGEARVRLQDALKTFPLDAGLAHMQARLLASSPDPHVRDGDLALEIAGRLMKARDDFEVRETFAMALAASGRFDDAVALQRELLAAVEGAPDRAPIAERLRVRLARFEAQQPWAARSGEEIVAATLDGQNL